MSNKSRTGNSIKALTNWLNGNTAGSQVSTRSLLGKEKARLYRNLLLPEDSSLHRLPLDGKNTVCSQVNSLVEGCLQFQYLPDAQAPSSSNDLDECALQLMNRFEELLDVCDRANANNADSACALAEHYQDLKQSRRALTLLEQCIDSNPSNMDPILLQVDLCQENGDLIGACAACEKALALEPDNNELLIEHGLALLQCLDFPGAIRQLRFACERNPDDKPAKGALQRARYLADCYTQADQPSCLPSIELDTEELASGRFHPETLAVAAALYRRHGTLMINNAFDPAVIDACREQYMSEYQDYFADEKQDDALRIGNRRYQVTIALRGAFNNPGLYANPFVIALMKTLMGKKVILGSSVCATSLPGSDNQHLHKDHRALFTQDIEDIPICIPPVAITTMVPLVSLDENIGTTLVKKGSHRLSASASLGLPYQVPIAPVGSCFFMDLALSHKGQGNRTDKVRPILNMVYHQPWFSDNKNFHVQPPLRLTRNDLENIPKRHRSLLEWTVQPGPVLAE